MKHCFLAFVFLFLGLSASAGMVRVVEVIDGRTLVLDDNGRRTTITLGGVAFAGDEAAEAAAYLRRLVLRQWVLVETGGFVYRSPDALLVNGEMARHPWRGVPRFVYLGIVDPGTGSGRTKAAPKPAAKAPAAKPQSHSHKPRKRPHSLPDLREGQRGVPEQ